jgi:tetratricopeptide (TPR) repeat protein
MSAKDERKNETFYQSRMRPGDFQYYMNDNLEYIDDYFQKVLNEIQRQEFETRCISDESFAKEVATYIAMRDVLRQNLLEEKKNHWSHLVPSHIKSNELTDENETGSVIKPGTFSKSRPFIETQQLNEGGPVTLSPFPGKSARARKSGIRKWLSLAAAACVITFLLLYSMLSNNSTRDLVHEYLQNEMTISNTMDASRDSLQTGIATYNKKNYKEAIKTFSSLYASKPGNPQILRYLGQTYLLDGDYESALKYFGLLSEMEGLQSNPGVFLTAITLIERNAKGDQQTAKDLLQKVVSDKLEGETQAKVWLDKMN